MPDDIDEVTRDELAGFLDLKNMDWTFVRTRRKKDKEDPDSNISSEKPFSMISKRTGFAHFQLRKTDDQQEKEL